MDEEGAQDAGAMREEEGRFRGGKGGWQQARQHQRECT